MKINVLQGLIFHGEYLLSSLLEPGRHMLLVYYEPQGMTIGGTTATVGKLKEGTSYP